MNHEKRLHEIQFYEKRLQSVKNDYKEDIFVKNDYGIERDGIPLPHPSINSTRSPHFLNSASPRILHAPNFKVMTLFTSSK